MAEADFNASTTAENAPSAAAWSAFDDAYHRIQTLLDAVKCIAASHIDASVQEVADESRHWAPLFQGQISNIYSLAHLLGETLEGDLWKAAVAVRVAGERCIKQSPTH